MAANTAQRVLLAIEEKSLLRIYTEGAHTKAARNKINHLSVNKQGRLAGVKIGVFDSVPQVHLLNNDGLVGIVTRSNHLSLGILKNDRYLAILGVVPCSDPNGSIFAANLGANGKSASAKVIHIKVVLIYNDQLNVTVDTAVEGEIRLLRINAVVFGVIHLNDHMVLCHNAVGNIGTEGRITSIVHSNRFAVENDLCRCVYACKFDVKSFILAKGGSSKVFFVNAGTAIVVVTAILTVDIVPRVRNIYDRFGSVMVAKQPILVDQLLFSHKSSFTQGSPCPIAQNTHGQGALLNSFKYYLINS